MSRNNPLGTIWGLAKSPELHLTDEELHILVEGITGKSSLKDLTEGQRDKVVTRLLQLKDSVKHDRSFRSRGNTCTKQQRKKLYMLSEELGWDDTRLNGMCKRMFKVDAVEWLNYQQCSNLIEALKKMLEREERKHRE